MRARLPLLVVLVALFARADDRVRHVYVGDLTDGDLTVVLGSDDAPAFVVSGDELVPAPAGGSPRTEEHVLAAPSASASSAPPEMHPDRLTGTTTSTDYFESFTPAVAPYKRLIAFDAVREEPDGTPVLVVSDEATSPIVVLGPEARGAGERDAFWGTVVLDFSRGDRVVLPSVAPDARFLHARSEPAVDFVIERDVAGNHFVRTLVGGAGIVRATFLVDVSRGFFARPLPRQRLDALSAEVAAVPPSVRERALVFASSIGVHPGDLLDEALPRLVGHFRAFVESDEMPRATSDMYLDLARGGRGVCRHRAYAFVVTALALGLPAHYVQNEAHAWVEVKLRDGYLRIDLGGGTQRVDTHGLQDRPHHQVTSQDPFPRPEAFLRGLQAAAIRTDSPGGTAPGDANGAGASRDAEAERTVEDSNAGAASATPDGSHLEGRTASPAPTGTTPPGSAEASSTSGTPTAPEVERQRASLTLDGSAHRVYRGQMLELSGRLVDASGAGLVGQRIEIGVAPARLLGVALTDEVGRFALSVGIPPDLEVGEHPMRIEFPGSASHHPARAR